MFNAWNLRSLRFCSVLYRVIVFGGESDAGVAQSQTYLCVPNILCSRTSIADQQALASTLTPLSGPSQPLQMGSQEFLLLVPELFLASTTQQAIGKGSWSSAVRAKLAHLSQMCGVGTLYTLHSPSTDYVIQSRIRLQQSVLGPGLRF